MSPSRDSSRLAPDGSLQPQLGREIIADIVCSKLGLANLRGGPGTHP